MKSFRYLAVTAAVLAFLLAVLGSWVRINGAGMTCPDWPLCKGSVVPLLEGGVVLEWSHRFIAMLEGVVLLGAIVTGWRMRARIPGVGAVLASLVGIFLVQVALGGLTVQLSNRPDSVVLHWGAAMALLAALTTLATLAVTVPTNRPSFNAAVGWLAATVAGAFVTMCIGSYVSSSGAGLACPLLPGCSQSTAWGQGLLQHAQMEHRVAAVLFALLALIAFLVALRTSRQAAIAAGAGLSLLVVQVALGIANVVGMLPTALREAHAANAVATFLAFVVATVLAATGRYSIADIKAHERVAIVKGQRTPSSSLTGIAE